MKPVILHTIQVREVAAALDSQDGLELIQHHVNRETCHRYLRLTDQQYWRLIEFLKSSPVAHSDMAQGRNGIA